MAKQRCPICSREVIPNPRYPRYVCQECAPKAVSEDGRPLAFGNIGILEGRIVAGGFLARYEDTGEEYPSHECFIDGVWCRADEAYLGGIVIVAAG